MENIHWLRHYVDDVLTCHSLAKGITNSSFNIKKCLEPEIWGRISALLPHPLREPEGLIKCFLHFAS